MIFGKTKLELKVGIFVFLGLAILVSFVLLIGNFKTWTSGYRINFIFNFVNGVKLGAPVRFAGVDVGEVKGIRFVPAPQEGKDKVQITCWVRGDVRIPADSTVWVNTLGLLGEKYIEVMPGKAQNNFLLAQQSLTGKDPLPMHEVGELAKGLVTDLDELIVKVRDGQGTIWKLLYDDTIYKDLGDILGKVKSGEGTLGKLLYDDTVYKELEAFTIDIRKHPWKLLIKTKERPEPKEKTDIDIKEKPDKKEKSDKGNKGNIRETR